MVLRLTNHTWDTLLLLQTPVDVPNPVPTPVPVPINVSIFSSEDFETSCNTINQPKTAVGFA